MLNLFNWSKTQLLIVTEGSLTRLSNWWRWIFVKANKVGGLFHKYRMLFMKFFFQYTFLKIKNKKLRDENRKCHEHSNSFFFFIKQNKMIGFCKIVIEKRIFFHTTPFGKSWNNWEWLYHSRVSNKKIVIFN